WPRGRTIRPSADRPLACRRPIPPGRLLLVEREDDDPLESAALGVRQPPLRERRREARPRPAGPAPIRDRLQAALAPPRLGVIAGDEAAAHLARDLAGSLHPEPLPPGHRLPSLRHLGRSLLPSEAPLPRVPRHQIAGGSGGPDSSSAVRSQRGSAHEATSITTMLASHAK